MTPAINKAKTLNLAYTIHQYYHDDTSASYGLEAAEKLGVDHHCVFKTLVVSNPEGKMAVAVIPVSSMLNMKSAAKALAWKKAALADKHEVTRSTGYVLGGVSPLGQKKVLKTIIDSSAQQFPSIYVSAGKRGLEIEMSGIDLKRALNATFVNISDN